MNDNLLSGTSEQSWASFTKWYRSRPLLYILYEHEMIYSYLSALPDPGCDPESLLNVVADLPLSFMHEAKFFILKQMMSYLESFGCWDSVEILPVCLRFQFKPTSWGQRGEWEQVTVSPSSGCRAELRALSSSVIFAERLRWPGFHPRQPWHQRSLVVVLWTSLEKPKQISSCATAPLDQSQSSQLPVGFA